MIREPTKLQRKYRSNPMQVIEVLPGDTYRIADLSSPKNNAYASTAHVSKLKSWKIVTDPDNEDNESDNEVEKSDHEEESIRPKRVKNVLNYLKYQC